MNLARETPIVSTELSDSPRNRMLASLEGLSVGDAFGEQFFWHPEDIPRRRTDVPYWRWTDDTEMALSIAAVLMRHGEIDGDRLAESFAGQFDPRRGYGAGMLFELLPAIQHGADWRTAARSLFNGGSFGNGGSMRVAPLGAWFADDLDQAAEQARRSAEVTHAHPEGIAGAVAVAIAAAVAANHRREQQISGPRTFVEAVREHVPQSEVRSKLDLAYEKLGPGVSADRAAELLGNGDRITAQDTVPFCVWMAGAHLDDYEEALWQTVSVHGDMDTTCAIVGGIVAANVGIDGIPAAWREAREPLPGVASGGVRRLKITSDSFPEAGRARHLPTALRSRAGSRR